MPEILIAANAEKIEQALREAAVENEEQKDKDKAWYKYKLSIPNLKSMDMFKKENPLLAKNHD